MLPTNKVVVILVASRMHSMWKSTRERHHSEAQEGMKVIEETDQNSDLQPNCIASHEHIMEA